MVIFELGVALLLRRFVLEIIISYFVSHFQDPIDEDICQQVEKLDESQRWQYPKSKKKAIHSHPMFLKKKIE